MASLEEKVAEAAQKHREAEFRYAAQNVLKTRTELDRLRAEQAKLNNQSVKQEQGLQGTAPSWPDQGSYEYVETGGISGNVPFAPIARSTPLYGFPAPDPTFPVDEREPYRSTMGEEGFQQSPYLSRPPRVPSVDAKPFVAIYLTLDNDAFEPVPPRFGTGRPTSTRNTENHNTAAAIETTTAAPGSESSISVAAPGTPPPISLGIWSNAHASTALQKTSVNHNPRESTSRRPIWTACSRCRSRKSKCSGDLGDGKSCVRCRNVGVDASECIFPSGDGPGAASVDRDPIPQSYKRRRSVAPSDSEDVSFRLRKRPATLTPSTSYPSTSSSPEPPLPRRRKHGKKSPTTTTSFTRPSDDPAHNTIIRAANGTYRKLHCYYCHGTYYIAPLNGGMRALFHGPAGIAVHLRLNHELDVKPGDWPHERVARECVRRGLTPEEKGAVDRRDHEAIRVEMVEAAGPDALARKNRPPHRSKRNQASVGDGVRGMRGVQGVRVEEVDEEIDEEEEAEDEVDEEEEDEEEEVPLRDVWMRAAAAASAPYTKTSESPLPEFASLHEQISTEHGLGSRQAEEEAAITRRKASFGRYRGRGVGSIRGVESWR